MAFRILKNLKLVAFALAVCASLTACPNPEGPPPTTKKHVPSQQDLYIEHTISYSGETLAEIAAWYTGKGINWTAIRDANPSIRPDRLRLGQVILIPRELVINEKPFVRKAGKKTPKAEATPEANATQAPTAEEIPTMTPTEAPALTPTDAPSAAPTAAPTAEATAAPTAEPTLVPTAEPTAPPAVETPKPSSKDLEREKLLDELLK